MALCLFSRIPPWIFFYISRLHSQDIKHSHTHTHTKTVKTKKPATIKTKVSCHDIFTNSSVSDYLSMCTIIASLLHIFKPSVYSSMFIVLSFLKVFPQLLFPILQRPIMISLSFTLSSQRLSNLLIHSFIIFVALFCIQCYTFLTSNLADKSRLIIMT